MTTPRGHGRIGSRWRTASARVRHRRAPCHLCGQPIDYALPYTHPRSFTVDHLLPVATLDSNDPRLLDPQYLDAAHRDCNSRRGTRDVADARQPSGGRDWWGGG